MPTLMAKTSAKICHYTTASIQLRRQNRDPDNTTKTRRVNMVVYIAAGLAQEVEELTNVSSSSGDLEAQWLKINRKHTRDIILCNIYRPPTGSTHNALEALIWTLNKLNLKCKGIFLLGFSINYKNKSYQDFKELSFFQSDNSVNQMITNETRVCTKSKSLIDLILTNADYIAEGGTHYTFTSYHQPIYVIKK